MGHLLWGLGEVLGEKRFFVNQMRAVTGKLSWDWHEGLLVWGNWHS